MDKIGFLNPDIQSSYFHYQMGEVLYKAVLESRPKTIIDFGLLHGYSTVCLGMAAKEIGSIVYAYDIFEDYPFNKSDKNIILSNVYKYDLKDHVKVEKKNFFEWIKNPTNFDFLHVDVSNTGDTLKIMYDNLKNKIKPNSRVLFEGGSRNRDMMDWMLKYEKTKFSEVRNSVPYKVLSEQTYIDNLGRVISPSISEILFGGGEK
jgi:hypothetical protein